MIKGKSDNSLRNLKFLKVYNLLMHYSKEFLSWFKNASDDIYRNLSGTNRKISKGYGQATLFEICLFFANWLGLTMFSTKQKSDIFKGLIDFITNRLITEFQDILRNNNLNLIVKHRMESFLEHVGKFDKDIDKDIWDRLYAFVLFPSIVRSQNRDKLEVFDMSIKAYSIKDSIIENALTKGLSAAHIMAVFYEYCLQHLFQDNDDFTQLSLEELDVRIKAGIRKAEEKYDKK